MSAVGETRRTRPSAASGHLWISTEVTPVYGEAASAGGGPVACMPSRVDGAAAAAAPCPYTSDSNDDDEEKGSDRDPIGGAPGDRRRLVECRNPVWCEEPAQDAACRRACDITVEQECALPPGDDSQRVPTSRPGIDRSRVSLDNLSVLSQETSSVTISQESLPSDDQDEPLFSDFDASLILEQVKTSLGDSESFRSVPDAADDPSTSSLGPLGATSQLELVPNSDDSDDEDSLSLSGGVSRFLRASMRKMWHFRLSSRGLRRRSSASQHSQAQAQAESPFTPRSATESRAARLAAVAAPHHAEAEVCCRPDGEELPQPGLDSVGGAQTQAVYMSTLLDRLNSTSSLPTSSASGDDVILVSTREPRLHDAPLPALEETSVAFDTPPPPLPAEAAPRAGAVTGGRGARLLSRGSSFLGVYQTVPELSAEEETRRAARGHWQHSYSAPLACLTCTLGLGAICRFALFGGTYGVAFVIQFGILSLLVGMPLMTLHMTLGQYVGAGMVDMWRISPIFKGIGLAAVLAELILAVYTVVPTAWMLVFLRDSFVSSYDRYKWAACPGNCSVGYAELVTYTVPQYFNERVLQRDMSRTGLPEVGYLGFEISFNLAVVWILVYLSLGRGLRSYGKVVYAFVLLSIVSFCTVCIQLLSWAEGLSEFFTDRVLFDNVFWSTVPWVVAARETFLVWGLHGAALMAITSHNKFNHSLRRDTTLVALITLLVLFLSALFGYACLHTLRVGDIGYTIGSSSFETEQRSRFLIAPGIGSSHSGGTPPEVKHYTNLASGVIIKLAGSSDGTQWRSGYQVHRLATEIFPSLLAVVGGSGISSFWALVFYLAALLFGVGQQLAIWRCVVEAVVSLCPRKLRAWELTTTFVMCILGFGLSLPLMTEIGIHVIYFLDYCIGCLWWLVVIYVLELFAVFYMRGSPFASTQVVTILIAKSSCMTNWAGPFLSFVWHVILPMALLVLSVVSFRTGGFDGIFTWEDGSGYGYWGLWVRQLGSMLMMFPILMVPVVGLVQAIRYVKNGEGDLYDRIQSLYRPEYSESILGRVTPEQEQAQLVQRQQARTYADPPPKYTPPPSYSTATGSRLAKMLRQSMRRSVRHVRQLASSAAAEAETDPSEAAEAGRLPPHRSIPSEPPPSYASILLETLPAALRRSVRNIRSSLRRPPAAAAGSVTQAATVEESPAPTGTAPAHHQRSFSLSLLQPSPAGGHRPVPDGTNSLPRRISPDEVKEVVTAGRLSLPETGQRASSGRRPSLGFRPPCGVGQQVRPAQSGCEGRQKPAVTAEQVRQVLRGGSGQMLVRPASQAAGVSPERTLSKQSATVTPADAQPPPV